LKTQVAIVGGGPGGTATAMFLKQAGISSVIVEKAEFPRFHIGESMTGECGGAVRLLGLEKEMMEFGHPIKWGTRVYGPKGNNSFYVPVKARTPEGPLQEISTWQVRRSDFDQMLYNTARNRGIEIVRGEALQVLRDGDEVSGVTIRTESGETQDIHADVVVDASGQSTFLSRAGAAGKKNRGNYDNQVAIFSQVKNAVRDTDRTADDTLIFYQKKHHWAWFIPIDGESVSVGVVVPADYFASRKESKPDFLRRELRELNPELSRRIPDVTLTDEVRAISNYSYEIERFTGRNFLCVGDSHRFIDPIFSFGVFFAMKEAELAANAIQEFLSNRGAGESDPFANYAMLSTRGLDTVQELVDAFWNEPLAFAVMMHSRYTDDCIDIFAGRVYNEEPSAGLQAFRTLNRKRAEHRAQKSA
jgi:1H-pyrrole-2-carbonyl-[peptidyl-carrier protein] brominase